MTLAYLGVSGTVTDLYDFNYEGGGLFQAGATLQVGWDTAKGRNAGRIFLVEAQLYYTFDNTDWDPLNNWSFNLN